MSVASIQHQFEILRQKLFYLSYSKRNQIRSIDNWLRDLASIEHPLRVSSYIREIVSQLFSIVDSVHPTATDPSLFTSIRKQLQWVQVTYPTLFRREEFDSCSERLLQHERTLYCYLGMPFHGESDGLRSRFLPTLDSGMRERDVLSAYIHFLEHETGIGSDQLDRIAQDWDAMVQPKTGSIVVPLIEQDVTNGTLSKFSPFVTLTPLQVHFHQYLSSNGNDQYEIANAAHRDSADILNELMCCTEAARRIAPEYIHHYIPEHYVVGISFNDIHVKYTGRSFGLGYTLELLSLISMQSFDKKYYMIDGASAFTGSLEHSGRVVGLDEKIMKQKADGLFFSPFERFIIPKENTRVVEDTIDERRKQFPFRTLQAIPAGTLQDVFDRRHVVHVHTHPFRTRIVKFFKQHQTKVSVASIGTLLCFAILYLLFGVDFDTNPDHIVIRGNSYVIQNKKGHELWRTPSTSIKRPLSIEQSVDAFRGRQGAIVIDIDSDGTNEVVLGRNDVERGFSDRVYCYNYDGTLRWAPKIGLTIQTAEGTYLEDVGFRVGGIAVLRPDSIGSTKIVAATSNHFYTDVAYLLDSKGTIISYYLHLGTLDQPTILRDRDKGNERVLMTGVANGSTQQPVAVVLDPKHWFGVCPQAESHRLLSPILPLGKEAYYIKFPIPELARVRGNPPPVQAHILPSDDSLIVIQTIFGQMPKTFPGEVTEAIYLLYTFNARTMTPVSVSTSSEYDVAHRILREEGIIHFAADSEYKKFLLGQIEYWDGERFVKTPTMNQRYLKAVAAQNN